MRPRPPAPRRPAPAAAAPHAAAAAAPHTRRRRPHPAAAQVKRPTRGNLLLPASWAGAKCIDAAIDPTIVAGRGPGRPADFVLHVTSAACAGGTVAYAGVCAVGGDDNRPVVGAINLCPGSYDGLAPRRQMEVITHELLHALVGGGRCFSYHNVACLLACLLFSGAA